MNKKEKSELMNCSINIQSQEESYGLRVPQLLRKALKDENSLKTIIKSPESLLENLFEGISSGEAKKDVNTALSFNLK